MSTLPAYQDLILPVVLASLLFVSFSFFRRSLYGTKATKLVGPPSPSYLFGAFRLLTQTDDAGAIHEEWVGRYGPAYRVADPLGSSRIIICDPRAITHFYSKETYTYVQTKFAKVFIGQIFGRGLLYAEGESHRRQRKALSPAFSNAAIRKLTHVFYDATYKVKAHWDSILDTASGDALIDVQAWMNRISIDSVGIAGFGHDFGAVEGKNSAVIDVFESFANSSNSVVGRALFLLSPVFPWLLYAPTKQNKLLKRMRATMGQIADEVLTRSRKELDGKNVAPEDKSIIGLLIKAELSSSSLGMSREEVLAQNVLLIAGYETTSISLTWALIELCRKPEKQQKLRDELLQQASSDPSFDQLLTGFPYLDGVVQETLRLHPPVAATTRVATEDDIIPFSAPVKTATGEETSSVIIKKGDTVTVPIIYTNRAEAFWGPNAREFEPERWLHPDNLIGAKELQGHRHLLTFGDGPRFCLGRNFALIEFKAVLSVLIRNYAFELPDGPDTKIENHPAIFRRPKVAGEVDPRLPLRVKRVE